MFWIESSSSIKKPGLSIGENTVISTLLKASRLQLLSFAVLSIILVALIDWRVQLNVSFGFLYLFPMLLVGICLGHWQIAAIAGFCVLLTELFDPFLWSTVEGIVRVFFKFTAYVGTGLFSYEFARNRRLALKHVMDVEQEIDLRRQAEQQLKILIETSPVAILTLDSMGTIINANRAAHTLLGFEGDALLGQSIKAFLPALANASMTKESMPDFSTAMQCRGHRRDGEVFPADIWFSTYKTSSGPKLTAMLVDDSENLRIHEEDSFHRLVAGSRLAVGAISHEIRNICGAVTVVCSNLSRNKDLTQNEDFRALENLVEGLGKIAALELQQSADSQQPTEVDLHSVLDELRIIAAPTLRETGISVRWQLPKTLPRVWADQHYLLQALLNLTRNSERAMKDLDRKELVISASVGTDRVTVRIHDTGRGVAEPEKLFRPFQPGADATGLGLYLSRAFVRTFRGDLRYEQESTGSCFALDLVPCNGQNETQGTPEING
jgi:two-component system, LuxR family, sensor kinase FixL